MPFQPPPYLPPDFSKSPLVNAPFVKFEEVQSDGILPENYHATSIFPEYFHFQDSGWQILVDSRMDCAVVLGADGVLLVKEARNIHKGELVACGRGENGEDGIFVHPDGFGGGDKMHEKFAFRSRLSRESPFSIDYDELYELLHFERQHGFILWVTGPAVVFDRDSRQGLVALIEAGYVQGLMAGNGFAVHDMEGALFGTALGQDIYSGHQAPAGHYNHLDTINMVRRAGSIENAVASGKIKNGIMQALVQHSIPFVLAGSIRDDGPLPGVETDVAIAQDRMRELAHRATTVIALATQLHTIATGNLVPSYRVNSERDVRPVYFYTVDMSDFVANKLANRGSLTAHSILTNAQDFVVTLQTGLTKFSD